MTLAALRDVQERGLSGLSNFGSAYKGLYTMRAGSIEPSGIFLIRRLINPLIVVLSLLCCSMLYGGLYSLPYIRLAAWAFIFSMWVAEPPDLSRRDLGTPSSSALPSILKKWAMVVGLLLLLGFMTKASEDYSRKLIATWFALTPMLLLVGDALAWRIACHMASTGATRRTHIVVGANAAGQELVKRLTQNACLGTFIGYFDDRQPERLDKAAQKRLLGTLNDLPDYVRRNGISAIHISLPAISQQRIRELLDQLRDTTASIYFVPDIYGCDLIQGRVVALNGLTLLAIRETPFCGIDGVVKRMSDVVLALAILAAIWPLLLFIAVAIKLTSPGPVVFKQRRYGLDGEEFWVYKFRTMRDCEDGSRPLAQAGRDDARVTPLGATLRRLSLDELPQVFNVLGGAMSVVGPRPHAVTHNEQYRKLVPGYMLRHKVRPGITGWAQVNGFRGETDTLEKMQQRIDCDLDYLRHWSLWLDLTIIFRTAMKVFNDKHAY